jgi:3-oxoacyl-[acyl-carrier protein] reductase
VSELGSVRDAFQEIFKKYKKLNVLVSNAGVLDDALIGMVTPKQIERTFSTNTYSVLYCAQYASRLIARSGGGSIINVSSIIGTNGNAGQAVYGGSKAAVIGITKSLAELAPQNIRVNAIAPGFIKLTWKVQKYQERLNSIKRDGPGAADVPTWHFSFFCPAMSLGKSLVDGGMLI